MDNEGGGGLDEAKGATGIFSVRLEDKIIRMKGRWLRFGDTTAHT